MTESLRNLLEAVIEKLFEPETKQHERRLEALIIENDKLTNQAISASGFWYNGKFWRLEGVSPALAMGAPSLHSSLAPQMAQLVHLHQAVDLDRKVITQMLTRMAQPCVGIQELRDVLPECLIALVPYLASYPRTREAAWTLRNNPGAVGQYQRILVRIETYCAMRFLY